MPKLPQPKTNIPRCGILTAIYYQKPYNEGGTPDLKVMGKWEPGPDGENGDGFFYIPIWTLREMAERGLVRQIEGAVDKDGWPKFELTSKRQRVCIRKDEDGKKKTTRVWPVDDQGQPVTLPAQPIPSCLEDPPKVPAGAQAPAGAPQPGPAGATPAAPPAPGAAPAAPTAPPATAAAAPQGQGAPAPATSPGPSQAPAAPTGPTGDLLRQIWAETDALYGAALAVAAFRQLEVAQALGRPEIVTMASLQAGAASVIIRLEHRRVDAVNTAVHRGILERLIKLAAVSTADSPAPAAASRPTTDNADDSEDEDDDLPF